MNKKTKKDYFEDIIGYQDVKKEFYQLLDMIHNKEKYTNLGVSLPKGILLHGIPGIGKSMIAEAFIKASRIPSVICRKNTPDGEFVNEIVKSFKKARDLAPSIIFLDDMDKFANSDENHKDAEEYVTVQSCIDEIKNEDVLVIATVNDIYKLPDSLTRSRRFDRKIRMDVPEGKEAIEIMNYYLSNKKVEDNIEIDVVADILNGCSCAKLETVINEAGITTAYEDRKYISSDDIIKAALYNCKGIKITENFRNEDFKSVAYHEAGHAVVSEILLEDSVAAIAIDDNNYKAITVYKKNKTHLSKENMELKIIRSLAGKAASEMYTGALDTGTSIDLEQTNRELEKLNHTLANLGFHYMDTMDYPVTNDLRFEREIADSACTEMYFQKAKKILYANREFLEEIANLFMEKRLVKRSDIAKIRAKCNIIPFTI